MDDLKNKSHPSYFYVNYYGKYMEIKNPFQALQHAKEYMKNLCSSKENLTVENLVETVDNYLNRIYGLKLCKQ